MVANWQCRLSPQDLLLNYGFFDPSNENQQASLSFDPLGCPSSGGGSGAVNIVVTAEGPDDVTMAWSRACIAGVEDVFAAGTCITRFPLDVACVHVHRQTSIWPFIACTQCCQRGRCSR